jgi:hypothetical protein
VVCDQQEAFNNPSKQVVVDQWLFENFGIGEVDQINYLDEQQLLEQANGGDVRAMYVLGLNYKWHATMVTFHSIFVRPKTMPEPEYKEKPLDRKIMAKARKWLLAAAYHGYAGALDSLAHSYDKEATYVEQQQDQNPQSIRKLKLIALAYLALQKKIMPMLSDYLKKVDTASISQQERDEFKRYLADITEQWRSRREAMGKSVQLDIELPPEAFEIEKMKDDWCK